MVVSSKKNLNSKGTPPISICYEIFLSCRELIWIWGMGDHPREWNCIWVRVQKVGYWYNVDICINGETCYLMVGQLLDGDTQRLNRKVCETIVIRKCYQGVANWHGIGVDYAKIGITGEFCWVSGSLAGWLPVLSNHNLR